jgi:hypothetical protein
MSPTRTPGRAVLTLRLVLSFYALTTALMPLAHHDIACHLKSTTHCVTCVYGSSAEQAADPATLSRFGLDEIGAAPAPVVLSAPNVLGSVSSDRAPPAVV